MDDYFAIIEYGTDRHSEKKNLNKLLVYLSARILKIFTFEGKSRVETFFF